MEVLVKVASVDDIPFLAACGHTEEDKEIQDSVSRKTEWFRKQWRDGLISLVGFVNGERAGCLNVFPIENSPWGPKGKDLLVMPCLFVKWEFQGKGLGRALMEKAVDIARSSGKKGLVAFSFSEPEWFLPVDFFVKFGFEEISQNGDERLMWLKLANDATVPIQFVSRYRYTPVTGKVVIDLFFNTFCETSDIEAQRVREVAEEFGDKVFLNVHCADNHCIRERFELSRGIFINGRELFWGYEAPREGIREAVREALMSMDVQHD